MSTPERALWEAHTIESLPDELASARICGHSLAALDAYACACMASHFERGGLGPRSAGGLADLQQCHTDLSEVLDWHERAGRPPHPYLLRTHAITGAILAEVCRRAAKRRPKRRWWQMKIEKAEARRPEHRG